MLLNLPGNDVNVTADINQVYHYAFTIINLTVFVCAYSGCRVWRRGEGEEHVVCGALGFALCASSFQSSARGSLCENRTKQSSRDRAQSALLYSLPRSKTHLHYLHIILGGETLYMSYSC